MDRESYDITRYRAADYGRLLGALAAFAAGKDVNLAIRTANNAVDHNFLLHDDERAIFRKSEEKAHKKVSELIDQALEFWQGYCEASDALDQFWSASQKAIELAPAERAPHWQREFFRIALSQDGFEVFDPALKPVELRLGLTREDTKALCALPG